jgi:hypothetical protein
MVASQEYTYVLILILMPNPCERYNFRPKVLKTKFVLEISLHLQGYEIIIVKCRKSQKLPCGRNAAIPGSSEVAYTSARRPTDCCISRGVQQASR